MLDLRENNISDGSFLKNLTNLQMLDLRENNISDLTPLLELPRLRTLWVEKNGITFLPYEILQLGMEIECTNEFWKTYGSINVYDNPIESPPMEIIKRGHQPIRDWFEAGEKEPLKEAKVLVVGESAVGKTSLIKQLLGKNFNPNERKTHDIARYKLNLSCQEKGQIDLRIWDFGGQEIMHATHQFFLTHRSVYLLVLDSRQNERQSRIEYWLRIIASFGGTSPVIIVCNKCDEETMNLDWRGLQNKFPQIRHFVKAVSCCVDPKTDEDLRTGLEDVRKMIGFVVDQDLKEVGEPFPKTWFKVKQQIEKDTRDYLPLREFNLLCKNNAIGRIHERETLLNFLNDLGIVLHFGKHHPLIRKNSPFLQDINVLNPAWVTAAVYRVLNDNELNQGQGVLKRTTLGELLESVDGHDYQGNQVDFILEMMRRFELCFDFSDRNGGEVLIPDLLPKEGPDTGDWDGSLGFRYHYSVLPSSVVSRFIVGNAFLHFPENLLAIRCGSTTRRDSGLNQG